jgi:hypothetical protein
MPDIRFSVPAASLGAAKFRSTRLQGVKEIRLLRCMCVAGAALERFDLGDVDVNIKVSRPSETS